jgi:hypothetical protein
MKTNVALALIALVAMIGMGSAATKVVFPHPLFATVGDTEVYKDGSVMETYKAGNLTYQFGVSNVLPADGKCLKNTTKYYYVVVGDYKGFTLYDEVFVKNDKQTGNQLAVKVIDGSRSVLIKVPGTGDMTELIDKTKFEKA